MMKTLRRGAADRTEAMAEATTLKRIETACREKGVRVTGQRRIIAQVVAELRDHPDVNELHRRVAEIDGRISLSTVYRTLKRFEELGILERHEFRDGRARYESTPAVHHDHLIDLTTGRILEFHSEDIERLQNEIARKLGYHLVGHRLELYVEPLMQKASRK